MAAIHFALTALFLCIVSCASFPTLNSAIPYPCGVNIHFTTPGVGEVRQLAAAGWKRVRMDFFWAVVERERGIYDFSQYDILLKALKPYDITPLFILDYGNPLYDDGLAPHSSEGIAAFTKFAVAAVLHFKGNGILWEMWNEPDLQYSWKPEPNATAYAALALSVGRGIKAVAPDEIYIGPALSFFDWNFFDGVFKAGVLEVFDILSLHGYGENPPENWITNHQRLVGLINTYKPAGKNITIICSEWGQSDVDPGQNKTIQAQWLVRQYLSTLGTETPATIWYDWHDDGTSPTNDQDHFGTVFYTYHPKRTPPYDPKPAYHSASTFMQLLDGYLFSSKSISSNIYVWTFVKNKTNAVAIVAWTSGQETLTYINTPLTLPNNACFKQVDYLGNTLPSVCARGRLLEARVSQGPLYFLPG